MALCFGTIYSSKLNFSFIVFNYALCMFENHVLIKCRFKPADVCMYNGIFCLPAPDLNPINLSISPVLAMHIHQDLSPTSVLH